LIVASSPILLLIISPFAHIGWRLDTTIITETTYSKTLVKRYFYAESQQEDDPRKTVQKRSKISREEQRSWLLQIRRVLTFISERCY
jgi:hypothetical protein